MTDDKRYRDPDVLRELYHDKRMSQREIGEELGVDQGTIYKWMDKHGIEARDRAKAHRMSMLSKPACFRTLDRGYEVWKTSINRKSKQVYVHRLLAVAKFGFDQVVDKQVHHKNGIRWDNRPENIDVLTNADHQRLHLKERDPDHSFFSRWNNMEFVTGE